MLISLDAVVHFEYEQCDTAPYIWQYSQLVVRWYTVSTYDLYMTPRSTTYRRNGTQQSPATSITQVVVYIPCSKKKMVYIRTYTIFSEF